jgi:hypothetical protein
LNKFLCPAVLVHNNVLTREDKVVHHWGNHIADLDAERLRNDHAAPCTASMRHGGLRVEISEQQLTP